MKDNWLRTAAGLDGNGIYWKRLASLPGKKFDGSPSQPRKPPNNAIERTAQRLREDVRYFGSASASATRSQCRRSSQRYVSAKKKRKEKRRGPCWVTVVVPAAALLPDDTSQNRFRSNQPLNLLGARHLSVGGSW